MTGLDSFTNPQEIGALYPFAGTEVVLAIAGILLWLAWHVHQMRTENRENEAAVELYRKVGTARALGKDGTEWLPDETALTREAGTGNGAVRGETADKVTGVTT
ncbi:MAG: hypothetical protein GEV00_09955 [Actinophytocola sp.]|nr:hypothetical protein [Actinophytocola sp.]